MNSDLRFQAVRKVTLISGTTNFLLAIFKCIAGWLGNSHALLADGLHSFSDLLTDALVFLATKAGGRAPDEEHPYGHRRLETIATIIIAIILIGVSIGIIVDAAQHFFKHAQQIAPSGYVIIVAIVSILCNESLYQYNKHIGNKIHSNLLKSNAWHNRSDAFTSIIVLLAVIGAIAGYPYFDVIGAIIIALFIFKMGAQLIWQGASELIDKAVDPKTLEEIKNAIYKVPGVESIHQLRTRLHSGEIFVDLHIIVNPFISVSEGHHIGESVHLHLLEKIPHVKDVTVHIDPENDETAHPSVDLPNRHEINRQLKACWKHLPGYDSIERITLHYLQGKLYIEVYIPTSAIGELNSADIADQYRKAAHVNNIASVVLHLIPS